MRVAAIIIEDNKILLIHRIKNGQDYYVFPGGGVKEGETLEEALTREAKEELTLDIKLFKQIFNIINQGQEECYFLVEDYDGTPKLNGEEKERMNENNQYIPVWIEINKAKNLPNLFPKEAREKLNMEDNRGNYLDINKETYDKSVEFAEESMKNPQNYNTVVEKLGQYLTGKELVLELGPGNGYVLKLLSDKGHKVVGIEFSRERAELSKKTAPKAEIIIEEFLTYNFGAQKYDLIIALEFIHLFPPKEFKEIMDKIYNLLNKNGLTILTTTMNEASSEGYLRRADGLLRYRRKFTKEELKEILKSYNYEILDFFETKRLSGEIIMNYICRK